MLTDVSAVVADRIGDIEREVVAPLLGSHLQQMSILLLAKVLIEIHVESGASSKVLDVGFAVEFELVDDVGVGVFDNVEVTVVTVSGDHVAIFLIPLGVLYAHVLSRDHFAVEHQPLLLVRESLVLDFDHAKNVLHE